MTDTEFMDRLPEEARIPTAEEFETIQFVYNYHPTLHPAYGKDQIAMLYSTFGMRIIFDMLETARRAKELDDERRKLRNLLEQNEREREELSMI